MASSARLVFVRSQRRGVEARRAVHEPDGHHAGDDIAEEDVGLAVAVEVGLGGDNVGGVVVDDGADAARAEEAGAGRIGEIEDDIAITLRRRVAQDGNGNRLARFAGVEGEDAGDVGVIDAGGGVSRIAGVDAREVLHRNRNNRRA